MKYISTRQKSEALSFKDVILSGLAHDGGLYVPNKLPKFSSQKLKKMREMNYQELFFEVTKDFVASDIDEKSYKKIIDESYKDFSHKAIAPIKQLDHNKFLVELFHGPTLAFKDFALQFLGNLMSHISKDIKTPLVVVGATSGDTGSAAIYGLMKCKSAKIFILHPHNKVSEVQRKQMTSVVSDNVFNIAVEGNFDDCQRMLKVFFAQHHSGEFLEGKKLIAVNSINWGRILAQIVYYFYVTLRLSGPCTFSVPTGNFGDIYAGFLAKKMGANIKDLIIATNSNDILDRFIKANDYSRSKLNHTITPSMDIQISSNFERMLFDFYSKAKKPHRVAQLMENLEVNGKIKVEAQVLKDIKNTFSSYSFSDSDIIKGVKKDFDATGEVIDPHSEIGILAAREFEKTKKYNGENLVCLATAHPAKFPDAVLKAGVKAEFTPNSIKDMMSKKERYEVIDNDIAKISKYITKNS